MDASKGSSVLQPMQGTQRPAANPLANSSGPANGSGGQQLQSRNPHDQHQHHQAGPTAAATPNVDNGTKSPSTAATAVTTTINVTTGQHAGHKRHTSHGQSDFPVTTVAHTNNQTDTPSNPLKKRNKPSLSCQACTVKKTKCDRSRPICFACVKRGSSCQYSELANLIEESHKDLGNSGNPKSRRKSNPQNQQQQQHAATPSKVPAPSSQGRVRTPKYVPVHSRSSTVSSPQLLSNVPFSHPTVSNLFKAEHPFSNYWTHQGGLGEVMGVLPSKEQADILVSKYFDVVDPVYPMLDWECFRRDYDSFWSLRPDDRHNADGSLVALIFVMLAMGTQFVALPSPEQREQTSEFYLSASHQALKVINYLGRPSIRIVQTQILITYFLMNDNHASDAWAFAGILIRQAYALGLNRDPSFIVPDETNLEKQQRRKLWQAVLFQDTFFSVLLKLPPMATHNDVRVGDLEHEVDPDLTAGATDITYIASMWSLANIVQPNLCSQMSLTLPISSSRSERQRLVSEFQYLYNSFPLPFRNFSDDAICELAQRSKRLSRQILFLTSNYYHCLMLIYADEHEHLEIDISGTLSAAHEAITSFFLLHTLFETEARVWYHFQNRAFAEALIIAEILKNKPDNLIPAPMRMRAKDDVFRMIGILQSGSEHDLMARTRVAVLNNYS